MAAQQEIANLCLQLMASQEQLQQTRQQDQMQAQALMQFHHEYQQLLEKNEAIVQRCNQHEKSTLLHQECSEQQQQYQLKFELLPFKSHLP